MIRSTVAWAVTVPPEVIQAVRPHLDLFHPFLPSWVREVVVTYDGKAHEDGDDVVMDCVADVPYRFLRITVRPSFLLKTEEVRRTTVAHELGHATFEPMAAVVRRATDELLRGPQAEFVWQTFKDALEGAVEDWALGVTEAVQCRPLLVPNDPAAQGTFERMIRPIGRRDEP